MTSWSALSSSSNGLKLNMVALSMVQWVPVANPISQTVCVVIWQIEEVVIISCIMSVL